MPDSFTIPRTNRIHFAFADGRLKTTGPKDVDFSTPADVNEIFQNHLPASGKQAITFYFHGGLVSSTQEFGASGFPYRAENQALFETLDQKSYPLFIVWETGVIETLKSIGQDVGENPYQFLLELVTKTAQSELFKKAAAQITSALSKKVAAMLGLGLAGGLEPAEPLPVAPLEENLAHIPEFEPDVVQYEELSADDEQEFIALLEQDEEFNARLRAIAEGGALGLTGSDRSDRDYIADDLLADINDDYDSVPAGLVGVGEVLFPLVYKKLGQVLLSVARRFASQRHHDFVPTVFEELARVFYLQQFAALLWKQMKDNALHAYAPNPAGDAEPHGGRYMIEQLKAYLLAHPETEVNLVGHSAGSIHISHFIEAADQVFAQDLPEFAFKNVILLAPGADFEVFEKISTRPQRFENLRIFTMSEEYEKKDQMAGFVYPHSILYFVSGVTDRDEHGDRPILGLARHLDRRLYAKLNLHDAQVEAAHQFLDELAQSSGSSPVVWAVTSASDPSGRRSGADKHGSFDNDPLTQESIHSYL
jgi:pimeloyl-ACP methyl ester carboxylesterase